MLKIIALKRVNDSEEEDDFHHEANVVAPETEFCCPRIEEDFQFGLGEYHTLDFNRYAMKLNFGGNNIDYCPYCGRKIEIELDTKEELEIFEKQREREEKYREYLRSLPPTPKKVVRKNKKKALADYTAVFDRYSNVT